MLRVSTSLYVGAAPLTPSLHFALQVKGLTCRGLTSPAPLLGADWDCMQRLRRPPGPGALARCAKHYLHSLAVIASCRTANEADVLRGIFKSKRAPSVPSPNLTLLPKTLPVFGKIILVNYDRLLVQNASLIKVMRSFWQCVSTLFQLRN